mmetsp:Transcript_96651/g.211325  ORF Transcript_96651/g.211325 Transcript_96651/m.211325 type:complete len:84 (-) Transcript_96651:295-546(-)
MLPQQQQSVPRTPTRQLHFCEKRAHPTSRSIDHQPNELIFVSPVLLSLTLASFHLQEAGGAKANDDMVAWRCSIMTSDCDEAF